METLSSIQIAEYIAHKRAHIRNIVVRYFESVQFIDDSIDEVIYKFTVEFNYTVDFDSEAKKLSYAVTTVRHHCLNKRRIKKQLCVLPDDVMTYFAHVDSLHNTVEPNRFIGDEIEHFMLHWISSQFTDRQFKIYYLYYWYDYKMREICDFMDLSIHVVKTDLHMGLKKLRANKQQLNKALQAIDNPIIY